MPARRKRTPHARSTTRVGTLLWGLVTGGAALITATVPAGVAGADQAEDDHFLARLEQEGIPALDGIPRLIYRANRICDELDSGTPVAAVVDELNETTFAERPILRLRIDRVTRTSTKFVIAAVEAYCPRHQGLLPGPP